MPVQRNNRELWLALLVMLLITLFYWATMTLQRAIPAASSFWGHTLGVLGFVLMLMTETLYSWRKRSRSARWGRMSAWLRFHIFTGLVGPYMVLLHTAWKFNGLAGIVTLFTLIIVASGVVGRYIYTAIPRTPDGFELEVDQLSAQMQTLEQQLQQIAAASDRSTQELARRLALVPQVSDEPLKNLLGRGLTAWQYRRQWKIEMKHLDAEARSRADQLQKLAHRRNTLHRQIESIALARRLLALWHAVHVPIGIALFVSAFVHIGGAIYYASLLR